MAKGWTKERRKAQAERCRQNAPWRKSTGPKTADGKARSSINAYKYCGFKRYKSLVERVCFHNAAVIKTMMELHQIELIKDVEKQTLILNSLAKSKKQTEGSIK